MNPEEKAKEILDKYRSLVWGNTMFTRNERLKKAALFCVDEIISSYSTYKGMHDQEYIDADVKYWKKIKEEIKRLS